jgi:hypothetical protein
MGAKPEAGAPMAPQREDRRVDRRRVYGLGPSRRRRVAHRPGSLELPRGLRAARQLPTDRRGGVTVAARGRDHSSTMSWTRSGSRRYSATAWAA